jgi:MOSC domain-containing protein YiiM
MNQMEKKDMSGTISHLFLKVARGEPMQPVDQVVAVGDQGLTGDQNYGARKRQVLLIEATTLARFGLVPGQIRENVTVEGLALAGLPPGTRLQLGPAVFEVVGDCAPCQLVEDIRPGLRQAISGRRGTLCRVVSGGIIRRSDSIEVLATG